MNKDIKQYQINEKVFYVMQGVCIVEDIIQIKQRDRTFHEYYRLVPVMDKTCTIYSPISSSNAHLRSIMSKTEWKRILQIAKTLKFSWEKNEQRRIIKRNKAMLEDDILTLIALVRMYHQTKKSMLNLDDEIWLKRAQQILVSELSEAMSVLEEEALTVLLSEGDEK